MSISSPQFLPTEVIQEFFNKYPLEEAQSNLWQWIALSIKGETPSLSQEDMLKYADFLDQLDSLIVAIAASAKTIK